MSSTKINVGCGRNIKNGWINLDSVSLPGVDIVFDLETCRYTPIPVEDDTVDVILISHVLEHISDTLSLMQELHRVARNGAICEIRVPHGSHNNAWEDQTHVRSYTQGSFLYFSQPTYHFADYGYSGDWKNDRIVLFGSRDNFDTDVTPETVVDAMNTYRNLVSEMRAFLTAVKPIRIAGKDYMDNPAIDVFLAP